MSKSRFTDLFIRRPVLATVISLLILVVGLRAIFELPVRQFPKLYNTVITITTGYPGASARLVEGFITTPLEKNIAGAEGIDYMTSSSTDGVSTINAYIRLGFNPNVAFTNIMSKVQETKSDLPQEAEDPVIQQKTGEQIALMYIAFSSKVMSAEQINDYISRVVQPKLETVDGVAEAQLLGGNKFAMRIWLNTRRMAAFGVTPNDVARALRNNNFQATAGKTKGLYKEIAINPQTDLQNVAGFKEMVIKRGANGALVRLRDIATVKLGSENYDSSVYFNGQKAVFVGITATPLANPLSTIGRIKKLLPQIAQQYPPTLHYRVVYDATKYIRASIKEVIKTILEAAIIVIIVIFLFLGSLRTVTIPVVTIPLSLIGVCGLMLGLGYSFNLLTLLAMVLAIGMVVDDAIVVVENIYRHIEEGMSPLDASIKGAREIALPVISMTLTLAAVYAPIGLQGGLTGALFKEFAFTLASAVIVSGIVALTLSPMMCSKVLTAEIGKNRFVHFIDQQFERLKNFYARRLNNSIQYKPATIVFAFVVLLSCFFLYVTTQSELAPVEDKGVAFTIATGPQSASLNYMEKFTNQFNPVYKNIKATNDYFIVNGFSGVSQAFSGLILKPWDERTQSQKAVIGVLQQKFKALPGLEIQTFPLPALPTGGDAIPLQFVITSTAPFGVLYSVMQDLLEKARASGKFIFVFGGLKYNKPRLEIEINRSKAQQLGIDMQNIAQALATALGGNYVNRFNAQGRSYKVIPQVADQFRRTPMNIENIYIRTGTGKIIPLSTVATLKYTVQPNALSHFQQLNSATISGMARPGLTLNDVLSYLIKEAKRTFPSGVTFNFAGQSRQLVQEGNKLLYTLFFSIIFIFLVLAAQFESFKDSLVILTSVPMAICGALLPLNWGLGTINIYTQVGLITLIGLISKHGILMVEFANKIQEGEGLSPVEAIKKSAAIRLRPILMTTFSMVFGVVPLLIATGAGAASRFDIGLVIASGMTIGTLFTLFVVPVMYTLKFRQLMFFLAAEVLIGGLLFFFFFYVL